MKNGGVQDCKVIRVIRTGETIGDGTEGNPVRGVYKLWTLTGDLICVIDQTGDSYVAALPRQLSDCD